MNQTTWRNWTQTDVVDAAPAAFALRTYLEQTDLRQHLQRVARETELRDVAEIGCGFGRMTVVLQEFAPRVTGFEREPAFVAECRRLHPTLEFQQVQTLAALPAPDAAFDLVLTFTALQHLINPVAQQTVAESKRITRPGGFVLLCEETDPNVIGGEPENEFGSCVIGRAVETYAAWFAPLRLISTAPRRIEPTYERADTGRFMLFQS